MKFSDYIRLGKMSIKSRKKSTKITVRGISFGLILLIPILFFALSFNIDLTNKINKVNTVSSLSFETRHFLDEASTRGPININNQRLSGYLANDYISSISSSKEVEDYLVSEYYFFNLFHPSHDKETLRSVHSFFTIDDNEKVSLSKSEHIIRSNEIEVNALIKICHPELSKSSYFTLAERNDIHLLTNSDSFFISGGIFSGDGKGQIILSETFVKAYNLDVEEVIGKRISFFIANSNGYSVDNNTDPNDEFPFSYPNEELETYYQCIKDYQIVGILKEDLYKLNSRVNEAHIWVTKSSFYDENNQSSLPITTYYQPDQEYYRMNNCVHTYPTTNLKELVAEVTNKGLIFLPIGFGAEYYSETIGDYELDRPLMHIKVQCKSYRDAYNIERKIKSIYSQIVFDNNYIRITNTVYNEYKHIIQIGNYAILIFLSFGGIIFLATLLNLYNSINYSVTSRINYLGVMRAIGAKQNLITRLYFVEILLIFAKSFIRIVIFSSIISFAIKYGVDKAFDYINTFFPFVLSLNFFYYPFTLVIVCLFTFLIAFLYSEVTCHMVKTKPILEILKDEK